MQFKALEKTDTTLYKGLAILMIVMHNFFHWVPPIPDENEFDFNPQRLTKFIFYIIHEPLNSFQLILSYLGHYGVQVFMFLSAYGLTRKYLHRDPEYLVFLWQRIVKTYPAFILAIILWAFYTGLGYGWMGPVNEIFMHWKSLLLKLTFISNFVPGEALKPVGPWWFLSLIAQFYIIFPFLLKISKKFGPLSLLLVSITSIVLVMVCMNKVDFDIYFTVLAHIPVFCLGIYLAQAKEVTIPNYFLFIILVVFILGNRYELFFYVSHLSALILLLVAFQFSVSKMKPDSVVAQVIMFLGTISMYLFYVNGFMRYPFIEWASYYEYWLYTLYFCLLFVQVAILASCFLQQTEISIRKLIFRNGRNV